MSPPFHLTADDVNMEMDSYRVTPGSKSQVSPRIFWDELENTSWKTEQDLENYSNVVERYWASEPKQVGGENAKYRAYRVQMVKRSQVRSAGEV